MEDDEEHREQSREDKEEQRRLEAQQERQRKAQEKKRLEEQESAKKGKPRVPGQKRKGLGGLSAEKKKLLKQLIMQKAGDEMKNEIKKRAEEKENHLKKIVGPLQIEGLNQTQLDAKVRELHKRINQLEEEKYDWEFKLSRQDLEINELTTKVNDTRGKFVKPVLKKITKTEIKAQKMQKQKDGLDLSSAKTQLKSTGQSKFALDEKKGSGETAADGEA